MPILLLNFWNIYNPEHIALKSLIWAGNFIGILYLDLLWTPWLIKPPTEIITWSYNWWSCASLTQKWRSIRSHLHIAGIWDLRIAKANITLPSFSRPPQQSTQGEGEGERTRKGESARKRERAGAAEARGGVAIERQGGARKGSALRPREGARERAPPEEEKTPGSQCRQVTLLPSSFMLEYSQTSRNGCWWGPQNII